MKNKHNDGYTLVELLVSIVILAAIVIPTCTSLTLSYRMNAKSKELMQAQLAVSSTVETLMAEGITDDFVKAVSESQKEAGNAQSPVISDEAPQVIEGTCDEFPGLKFILTDQGDYYDLTVTDEEGMVEVKTSIRDKTTAQDAEEVGTT